MKNIKNMKTITLRKKCPYSEFFWSVFSHIQTEYGESECGKIRTGKTQEYGHFLGSVNW